MKIPATVLSLMATAVMTTTFMGCQPSQSNPKKPPDGLPTPTSVQEPSMTPAVPFNPASDPCPPCGQG